MAIFRLFNMTAAAILDFQNLDFLTVKGSRGSTYDTVPNFVTLGLYTANIWQYLDFEAGGRRHLGFLKCGNFGVQMVQRVKVRHHAKLRGDRSNRC